jgi:hypothetical protein
MTYANKQAGWAHNQDSYAGQELFCLGMQRLACSFESADERLLGELFDDRFNGPS